MSLSSERNSSARRLIVANVDGFIIGQAAYARPAVVRRFRQRTAGAILRRRLSIGGTLGESPRLLCIGMDAFPPALVDEWTASGDLPNIAALIAAGRYGRVDSVADYFPGSVWATFASTSLPPAHGIHHFMHWDPARMAYRRPAPDWCDYTPFWHRVEEDGTPMVIFDLPFSFPKPARPEIVELHGWGLHDELAPPFSQPRGLLGEISRRHGRSALKPDVLGPRTPEALQRDLTGIVESVPRRVEIIEDLAERFPWRLFLAPFAETHRVGHWYWSERSTGVPLEGLKRVAVAIDRGLPRLRALLRPEDHFALFSLHGMGELFDLDRLNEPLIEYLEPTAARTAARSFDPVRLLNRALPGGLRRALSAALSTRLRDRLFGHYLAAGVDWSRTCLIAHPSDGCLYLRLNLQGRERDGIVAPAEKEALLDATVATLRELRDLEGRPVLAEVARTADLYPPGPRSHLLPDLVLRTDHPVPDTLRLGDGHELYAPWRAWRDGDHRPEGFYVQVGPGVTPASQGAAVAGETLPGQLAGAVGIHFRGG